MTAADRLIAKARDYEVLAASHSERGALVGGGEHLAAATAFTVAAIIMREVAAALEDECSGGCAPTERLAKQLGRQSTLDGLLQGLGKRESEGSGVLPQSQGQARGAPTVTSGLRRRSASNRGSAR